MRRPGERARAGRRLLTVAGMLALAPAAAWGHPHLWIEALVDFRFEAGELDAVDVTWRFDPLLSELLLLDYDLDKDGALAGEEAETIKAAIADGLMVDGFYAHLEMDGRPEAITTVDTVTVDVEDGLILYGFRMHLPRPVDPATTEVGLGLYDETYFIQIELDEDALTLGGHEGRCSLELVGDVNNPAYYGAHPSKMMVSCRPL